MAADAGEAEHVSEFVQHNLLHVVRIPSMNDNDRFPEAAPSVTPTDIGTTQRGRRDSELRRKQPHHVARLLDCHGVPPVSPVV